MNENEIKLSEEQSDAIQTIDAFLSRGRQVFILRGYAGTGKTTLIRYLWQMLDSKYKSRPHYLLAPTGRAAKVLRGKVGAGWTIHRQIYNLKNMPLPKNLWVECAYDPEVCKTV